MMKKIIAGLLKHVMGIKNINLIKIIIIIRIALLSKIHGNLMNTNVSINDSN